MRKCDQYIEWILTDYLDGQLDKGSVQILEKHLRDCSDCRVFLKEVKSGAVVPFKQAVQQDVPVALWWAIKENIEREQGRSNPLEALIERLKGLFALPRLLPVFVSLIVMLVVGSMTLNTVNIQKTKDKEQGEYLVSLLSVNSGSDSSDLGTSIEHYFL